QPQLVVREATPRVADGNRPRGLAAVRVALVHRDAAEVVLERFHRVEHRGRPVAHARVQAPTGRDEQREARADHLVADPNITFFVERHGGLLRHLRGASYVIGRVRSGYAASPTVGALLLSNAAASLATAVPSKKRGFCVPHSRTALPKTKSWKSLSVMRPSSTSSKASGSGSRMSTTSKCPMSEL